MPNKSISTIQTKTPITGSTMLLLANQPVTIFSIEGNVNSTSGTAYYIQLLPSTTPSSGVTVPLYSRLVVPSAASSGINGFSFVYEPGLLTSEMSAPGGSSVYDGPNVFGVQVAISSTDNVWTSVAANTDVTVVIEDWQVQNPVQSIVGDTVTPVDSLVVFADPNAGYRLNTIQTENISAASDLYLMLFAYSQTGNGEVPIAKWTIKQSLQTTLNFGGGLHCMQQDAQFQTHTGCYLYGSSTPQTLTQTTGGQWNIKAWYTFD